MNTPKISVIVPVYNVEKYLPRCIDSILSQTFTDFELLLIDDGSTDGSGKICDAFAEKDSRIRVFHQDNRGVSVARNLGIFHSNGEWICFVDSDDEVKENHLLSFISYMHNRYVDFYVCGYEFLLKSRTSISLPYAIYNEDEVQDFIINSKKGNLLGLQCNKMFNAQIIKDNKLYFDPAIWSYEDELFVLQYLRFCHSVMTIPHCTYIYYFGNPNSLSSKYIEINEHIAIAERLHDAGMQLKHKSDKYLQYLEGELAGHLCVSVLRLYWPCLRFTICKRISILRTIKRYAKDKNLTMILRRQLIERHFYSLNILLIELNGLLLCLYHFMVRRR